MSGRGQPGSVLTVSGDLVRGTGVWFGRVLFWVNGVWNCGAACDHEGQEELVGEVGLVTVVKRLN